MTENVVVLTALNLEYEAVHRRLVGVRPHRHERGTRFEVGAVPDTDCRVALVLTGKGNQPAAVLAERAIQEFEPAAVVFVGVAGALWEDTKLGDVVVATHVYGYHGGTAEKDGFKARPRVWEADHELSQLTAHVARRRDWGDDLGCVAEEPSVRFGAIAAGEVVHNSRISHEAELIRLHYNDALAIEMESAGVAQAGHLNGSPVAVIRGISDRADGTKNFQTDGRWQPRAADNAAAFAIRVIQEFVNDQEEDQPMRHRDRPGTGNVTNSAENSTIGIQARDVTNSVVRIASSPSVPQSGELAGELAAIREELNRARSRGALDAATYDAAQEELAAADEARGQNTSEGHGRFVVALKRLRGLVVEVAELASKVAALITAVSSLS